MGGREALHARRESRFGRKGVPRQKARIPCDESLVTRVLGPRLSLVRAHRGFDFAYPRSVSIAVLLAILVGPPLLRRSTSVYRSSVVEARLVDIHDEKKGGRPTPREDLFVDTRYGRGHVVASGPAAAPPMLLLHASGVSSWSWKYAVWEWAKTTRPMPSS